MKGVAASMPISMAHAGSRETPEITSGRRGPRRPTMRPESGDATTVMRAIGHGDEPGLDRREAARLLQVERVQEQEPAERGEGGDRDGDRGREGDRAEEAQVDEGLLAPRLVEQQARQRRRAAANAAR